MTTCQGCRDGQGFSAPFSMAFQPIVDTASGTVFAYEALVRGLKGQGAFEILTKVDETNRYAFDQACRMVAIETAARQHKLNTLEAVTRHAEALGTALA